MTGSKHLVTADGHRVLLDYGPFQGLSVSSRYPSSKGFLRMSSGRPCHRGYHRPLNDVETNRSKMFDPANPRAIRLSRLGYATRLGAKGGMPCS